MTEKKKFKLDKEQEVKIVQKIQEFFINERDEEIGELQASVLANLIAEEWMTAVYNKALADALQWFKLKMEYLEGDYYSLEK